MAVKLELYKVFKEVAEAGNITAAAQALYISQSAVSQSIKQLEGDLQTRLFARNSRGVTLTADGKLLYEYVRSAIGLLETGEAKLSQTRELQMGHLTIGASDTVTSQFLLPYLDSFHKQYPAIHIQIVSGRSHKVLGLLQSGKVDIAFASTPNEGSFETIPCFATHSIFVASPDYPCDFNHIYAGGDRGFPADPAGAEGQLPCFYGTGVFEGRRYPDPGDRAVLPAAFGDAGGDRSGRGWCDAGIRPEGPGKRRHPSAENGLHDPGAQRGYVYLEGSAPHGRGYRLYGNGAEGHVRHGDLSLSV